MRGVPVLRLGAFVLHPRLEPSPVPGWLVVAPRRHVEQWDALDARELREFGPLVAQVASALRASTPTAKVYVSVFAEVLPHFHVHVVARPPALGPEERGARLFLAEGSGEDGEGAAVMRRVAARLAGGATSGRSPWPSVLLSALVWPGAGQIRNGDRLKGAAFGLASLALLAVLFWRITGAAAAAILQSPTPVGPLEIWTLAEQIRDRNAGPLGGISFFLTLLWAASALDAWWGAVRRAQGGGTSS